MPAISRSFQDIFGRGLVPSGNLAVWGSLQTGSPAYSGDPKVIQSLSNYLNGLNGALIGNRSPALEDLNGLFYVFAYQLAYLLQSGVPEWNADTTYWTGQICRGIGTAVQYQSIIDNNIDNAVTDTNSWVPLTSRFRGPTVAAAWVEFDGINAPGGNCVIHSSYNVSSVAKNAGGNYTINFTVPMPTAHYVFSGSCGSEDGQAYGAGDDGRIVGNVAGQGNAVHSATQCRIFTVNGFPLSLVSPGNVSVLFFSL